MVALTNVRILTPLEVIEQGAVVIDSGKISFCGSMQDADIPEDMDRLDLTGRIIMPGMIDVHIHGLLGHLAMGEGLSEVIRALPRFGVTSFLATTVTLPEDRILSALKKMKAILEAPPPGAQCLGIHIEGPHLSPKRPGMANPDWFIPLTLDNLREYQLAAGGHIRMITFAPEVSGALNLIPEVLQMGIVPVIGHSDATYEIVEEAVRLGLAHATHTYNAMRPLHHRDPGVVGAVLALPEIVAELIADGHHVHPGAMRVLFNAKGVEGVCLISDAAPFAELPEGTYKWDSYEIIVNGGTCRSPEGILAGAYRLLDHGFRTLIRHVGLKPEQAATSTSLVPARALGIENQKGALLPGMDADIVVLDRNYEVELTFIEGNVAWAKRKNGEQ
ncbi:MAG: N-acetylglucosamine-6-phosphate deacetylase [Anaerolineales bacterium]|nr:N-acetylglucosamine-6-phosphate deacetylase [Anaerolineales bacterium]MCK5633669.1 N-acetylglucosamine-6-phosphate deacetylase [Anaerolineales bacterium]